MERLLLPIQMVFVVTGAKVFAQFDHIRQALDDAVHIACVAEVLQSGQTRQNDSEFWCEIAIRHHQGRDRRKYRLHRSIDHWLLCLRRYFIRLDLVSKGIRDSQILCE